MYKKSTDEEESGELFKRSVKNKVTTSMGMEKQMEHNKKRKHDLSVCSISLLTYFFRMAQNFVYYALTAVVAASISFAAGMYRTTSSTVMVEEKPFTMTIDYHVRVLQMR